MGSVSGIPRTLTALDATKKFVVRKAPKRGSGAPVGDKTLQIQHFGPIQAEIRIDTMGTRHLALEQEDRCRTVFR